MFFFLRERRLLFFLFFFLFLPTARNLSCCVCVGVYSISLLHVESTVRTKRCFSFRQKQLVTVVLCFCCWICVRVWIEGNIVPYSM